VTAASDPNIARRRVRSELRRFREERDETQSEVAAAMDWSLSKVIRIESGTVGISTTDLQALLHHYLITAPSVVDSLVTDARTGRGSSWWRQYRHLFSPSFAQFLSYERAASIIRVFQPLAIPGLLQTREYAEATLVQLVDEPHLADHVQVRMLRQEVLTRETPPAAHFVLDEAVLRRRIGGDAVMRGQLRQLRDLMKQPHITIDVLPFTAGAHPAMAGSYTLLDLPGSAGTTLTLEPARGELLIHEEPDVVKRYSEVHATLAARSLDEDRAVELLDQLAIGRQ
jgi:transcriptional regulator with XRE-family HTH domain